MTRKEFLFGIAVLSLVALGLPAAGALAADGQGMATSAPSQDSFFPPVFADGNSYSGSGPVFVSRGQSPSDSDLNLRFGWWFVDHQGSLVKTGEFQDLKSSPFWDIDTLRSDGMRTFDFTATGTDDEGTQARLYYFGPRASAKIDYDRFLRRLDRDPFDNFDSAMPLPGGATRVLARTMNDAGQDYAIRVQEFDAKFKGDIGDNLKWRLNTWGLKREGDRQATALGHCYNPGTGSRCHIASNRQMIDWTITEVQPVLEAKLGPVTAEYSRTMRAFDTNDSIVTRQYNTANHTGWQIINTDIPYAVESENYTQIDRIKLGADVSEFTKLYANLFAGNTHNKARDVHRYFNGIDVRGTNDRIEGVAVTGYGKLFNETGQLPSTFPEAGIIQGGDTVADYRHPINYGKWAAGVKGRWRPHDSGWPASEGLAVIGGYEYRVIERDFAEYELPFAPEAEGEFIQQDTKSHVVHIGTSRRWSPCFDTFVRYKNLTGHDPLFGLRHTTGDLNSNQPTHEDLIEFGGTWTPTDNFLLTASFGIEKRHHKSWHVQQDPNYALPLPGRDLPNPRLTEFDEDNFPIVLTAWYAPSEKWSFTAGYATFSNFIDQLITLGDEYNNGTYNPGARDYIEPDAWQSPWRFYGRSHVVNLGGSYAWSKRLTLTGGIEYVRGSNVFVTEPPGLAMTSTGAVIVPNWSTLPGRSAVIVETTRLTAGVDYWWRERISTFLRYNYFDYDDQGAGIDGGTAHMALAGVNAMF
jgi:hypothetical protein